MTLEMTRGFACTTALVAMALVTMPGCGDGGGGDTDAGTTTRMDAGSREDAGSSTDDAGSTVDGGGTTSDSGPVADGSMARDSGSTRQDSGVMGTSCGGRGSPPCIRGTFCLFPDTECGRFDGPGVCTERPELCADIFAPVCGCDGMTYGNRCEASGAGVSVDFEGECRD